MLVLDTSALLSFIGKPSRLGRQSQKLLAKSGEINFSSVSLFEMAFKSMLGKLRTPKELETLVNSHGLKCLPLSFDDAREVYSFTSLIRHDPFDRMILATTKANRAILLTSDRALLALEFDWVVDSTN